MINQSKLVNSYSSFLPLLAGLAIGSLAVLLFTPNKGRNLRSTIFRSGKRDDGKLERKNTDPIMDHPAYLAANNTDNPSYQAMDEVNIQPS
ncbi:YtxH domain-containing protein [Pedobacter sp. SYSU D00535]|uniref:YtxH domain-containing protein n=1 Tax=Pedobacter sp. SYSU D00535 TaxID=2810308 RepID=UPI001A968205|nr:YtxH domain-containing protein [Pedobacter sp. SYSU D00535]